MKKTIALLVIISLMLAITIPLVALEDVLWGDANGDGVVSNKDIVRLKKYLANYDEETGLSIVDLFPGSDANGDGIVSNKDIVRLKNYFANYDELTGKSNCILGPETPPPGPSETYMVTFYDYDGTTILKTQTVNGGEDATPPADPIRDGYTFTGWSGSYENVTADTSVVANYAYSSTEPTILVKDGVHNQDGTYTVEIMLLNNPGLCSLMFDVSYGDSLSLSSVVFNTAALGENVTTPQPYSSPQTLSFASPTAENHFSGLFATLTFTATEQAVSGQSVPITLTYDEDNVFDIDLDNVYVAVVNAQVII